MTNDFFDRYPHLRPNPAFLKPEPVWKKAARKLCDAFELGDHEYIRGEWRGGRWFRGWLTIIEPRYRRRFTRLMPWRVRFGWASLLRQRIWSRCTGCGKGFSFAELSNPRGLQFFMSGSIIHKSCEREVLTRVQSWDSERGDGGNATS